MRSRSRLILGLLLILFGIMTIINNMNLIRGNFILYIIGAAFLIIYFVCGGPRHYKNIGFLFPAFFLPAIELSNSIERYNFWYNLHGGITLAMLGASFLLIFAVHSVWQKDISKSKRNWPLVVGVILILISLANLLEQFRQWEFTKLIFRNFWPVILILVGLYILFNNFMKKSNDN